MSEADNTADDPAPIDGADSVDDEPPGGETAATGDDVVFGDLAVPDLELTPPVSGLTRADGASVLAAVALHVAVLYAIVSPPAGQIGDGGTALDAIAIELVDAPPSLIQRDGSEAAPLRGTRLAMTDGGVEASAAAMPSAASSAAAPAKMPDAQARVEPEPKPEPEPAPESKPEPEPDEPAEDALRPPKQQDMRAEETPPEDKPPEDVPKEADRQDQPEAAAASAASEAADAIAEGGAVLRGVPVTVESGKAAPAVAPGMANAYAKSLIQALAKSRPSPGPTSRRGTVMVWFELTPEGGLSGARVTRSSGDRGLDEAALRAVKAARFPAPPAEMAGTTLSYEIPYIFR